MNDLGKDALSRRDFIAGGTGALAVLGMSCSGGFLGLKGKSKIPIGLQLYSVRMETQKDFDKTVAAVAGYGYEGVEFAGYGNKSAADVRALLDANGLKCCGTHTGLDTMLGDAFQKTVEFNQTIGNKYLIVPSLPQQRRATKQALLDTAKVFNEIAAKLKPLGMQVGYHNHTQEFQPIEGEYPLDILFGNTVQDVIVQLDIGWATAAKIDPAVYLKKYPGRAVTVHVKEHSSTNREAFVGEGEVKWKDVFGVCESVAGTKWYIVEDERKTEQLPGVQKDLQNLRAMGK